MLQCQLHLFRAFFDFLTKYRGCRLTSLQRDFLGHLAFGFQLVKTNVAEKIVKIPDLNIIRRTESTSIFCLKDVILRHQK